MTSRTRIILAGLCGLAAITATRFRVRPVRGYGTFWRQFTVEEQGHSAEVFVFVQMPRSASSPIEENRHQFAKPPKPTAARTAAHLFSNDWHP